MANGYRNALVQQIKDAGQELINRAESMVHPDVVNKVACDRVIYQKGESNVSKI